MRGTQPPTTPSVRWFHDGLTPLYLCVCVSVPVRVQCVAVPVDACRCGWRGTTWRSAGGRVTKVRFHPIVVSHRVASPHEQRMPCVQGHCCH